MAYQREVEGGGRILPNSRAIALQQCGQCRRAGRTKGRLTSAQATRSKTISWKSQVAAFRQGFVKGDGLGLTRDDEEEAAEELKEFTRAGLHPIDMIDR